MSIDQEGVRRRRGRAVTGQESRQASVPDEGNQELRRPDETAPAAVARQQGLVFTNQPWPESDETMLVNLGPQHPSTHGVLRVMLELDGETIVRAKPVIGYLHTGMEKTGEQLTYVQGATNVTRMDYVANLFNETVFSLAVEALLHVDVPPRATWIRMLMCELNRVSSHLLYLATNGMDIGAISMMLYGWREREAVLAFFEKVTGLRLNYNYIRPGGVAVDLPPGWEDDVVALCETIPTGVADYEQLLTENPIWLERTVGVGTITTDEALALGVSGPILRSTGLPWDLRKAQPHLAYDEVEFDVIYTENGDSYDRYRIRLHEIGESLRIARQCVEKMPDGDYRVQDKKVTPPPRARLDESMEALIHHFKLFTEGFRVPAGETYVAIESPRGELGCYLVSDGSGRPYRLHIRGPSFYNLQAMPVMMRDRLLADGVTIISSIDPIMGDVDR